MRINVLKDRVEVVSDDGHATAVKSIRSQLLLAALVLETPRVETTFIRDLLWPDGEPPKSFENGIQKAVTALRDLVGSEKSGFDITEDNRRYSLVPNGHSIDYTEFVDLSTRYRNEENNDVKNVLLQELRELLGEHPLSYIPQTIAGDQLRRRVIDFRESLEVDYVSGRIRAEGPGSVVDLTSEACRRYPANEQLVLHRMNALTAAGRRGDALKVYESFKDYLDENAFEVGPELREAAYSLRSPMVPKAFDAPTAVRSYLGRVITAAQRLKFGDATVEPGDSPGHGTMSLDKVWTPLNVALPPPRGVDRLESRTDEEDLLAALAQPAFNQAVLLAPPGGGKSTALAYRTLVLAESALATDASSPVPVHVRLSSVETSGDNPSLETIWTGVHEVWTGVHEVGDATAIDTELTGHLDTLLHAGQAALHFDGLDEIQEDLVPSILALIRLSASTFSGSIVVSCRTFDYESDFPRRRLPFPSLEIQPFQLEQQLAYVSRWYDALAILDSDPIHARRKGALQRTLKSEPPGVSDMAATPLLLALITLVHTQDGELPAARAVLYSRTIGYLLAETAMWRANATEGSTVANREVLRLAQRVGFRFHEVQESLQNEFRGLTEQQITQIAEQHLGLYDTKIGTSAREDLARKVENYVLRLVQSNGLLVEQGGGTYDFAFKQYREYLAGLHLATTLSDDDSPQLADRTHWHESLRLLAGNAANFGTNIDYLLYYIDGLLEDPRNSTRVIVGAEMLAEIGRATLKDLNRERLLDPTPGRRLTGLWFSMARALTDLIDDAALPLQLRIQAGTALGALGDLRLTDEFNELRPLATRLVHFQAVITTVGTDMPTPSGRRKLDAAGASHREVELQPFSIGKYPVTNLEYQRFIAAGGYQDAQWWTSEEAGLWRAGDIDFIDRLRDLWLETARENYSKELQDGTYTTATLESTAEDLCRPRKAPYFARNRRFNNPNQPLVGVNFWEARAYCAWLTHHSIDVDDLAPNQVVRLPTEWEWEHAAHGPDGTHSYPWGEQWDPTLCRNRDDPSGLTQASPVGCYPNGTWPGGPLDLAGNVWEWTSSRLLSYDNANDGHRESADGLAERVIRGSSWYDGEIKDYARSSSRFLDLPGNVYFDLGFRIAVAPA